MKVLFTFFNPSGGMETLNRIRSRALMSKGVECHLLYSIDGEGRQNINDIPTFIMKEESDIRDLIQREQYDAIIVCTDIHLLVQLDQIGYKGILIYELQGLGTPEDTELILENYKSRIEKHAQALLYPHNAYLKGLLEDHFPNLPHFCFDDPLETEQFGYMAGPRIFPPIIGWVGRLQHNKNWGEFLQIGARLLELRPDIYLWMFDDHTLSHPQELKAFLEVLSVSPELSQRLYRYSNVPHKQMAKYLSAIGDSGGLLLSTSIQEGFGYVVAESMLCRCPVLSTDSGGVRRLVHHDLTGVIYSRGNIEDAVNKALLLMTDANRRAWLIQNAEAHVRKHFSADLYSTRFIEMLKRLTRSS